MKNVLMTMILISLCSCGSDSGSKSKEQNASEESQSLQSSTSPYLLPQIGHYRAVTIDNNISGLFEDMTINPKKEGEVLGDEAFYVMVNEQTNPSYVEYNLGFYSRTKINNVFYINLKQTSQNPLNITKDSLTNLKMKESTEVYRRGLTWGKKDFDIQENDMLNKAYVIRMEERERRNKVDYAAQSTYLIWFECIGNVQNLGDYAYSCGKYNLKLHYKLLDYSLEKQN